MGDEHYTAEEHKCFICGSMDYEHSNGYEQDCPQNDYTCRICKISGYEHDDENCPQICPCGGFHSSTDHMCRVCRSSGYDHEEENCREDFRLNDPY